MTHSRANRDPLAALFRDIVLTLGGVVATGDLDDETIERIAPGFESAYRRAQALADRRRRPSPATRARRHPAIVRLLDLTGVASSERAAGPRDHGRPPEAAGVRGDRFDCGPGPCDAS